MIRVKVNRAAVRNLLRSPEIAADLERRANNIATAAGEGFDVDVTIGRNRARADVATDTPEAMHAEATTRALTTAIDAGRR